ncbi:MAG: hypothetical protein ACLUDG_07555, partial [Butyricicoccus sp.]
MAKNLIRLTVAAAGLAGAGAAAVLAKKKLEKHDASSQKPQETLTYRNTELGAHEKNSKGIYYT